jgi:hypothetical protein
MGDSSENLSPKGEPSTGMDVNELHNQTSEYLRTRAASNSKLPSEKDRKKLQKQLSVLNILFSSYSINFLAKSKRRKS